MRRFLRPAAGGARRVGAVAARLTDNFVANIKEGLHSRMRPVSIAPMPDEHPSHRDEIRKLTSLVDVSQALSGTLNLRSGLHRVLEILERHHAVTFGMVLLHADESENPENLEKIVSGSKSRVRALDELARRVLETGRPVVVPRVSQEPTLRVRPADKRGQTDEVSVVAVPVSLARRPVGALAVELGFKPGRIYDRSSKFLGVAASMIAQAVKVQRLVEARAPAARRRERSPAAGAERGATTSPI